MYRFLRHVYCVHVCVYLHESTYVTHTSTWYEHMWRDERRHYWILSIPRVIKIRSQTRVRETTSSKRNRRFNRGKTILRILKSQYSARLLRKGDPFPSSGLPTSTYRIRQYSPRNKVTKKLYNTALLRNYITLLLIFLLIFNWPTNISRSRQLSFEILQFWIIRKQKIIRTLKKRQSNPYYTYYGQYASIILITITPITRLSQYNWKVSLLWN